MIGTDLKTMIREVPDYPKPGITFYDLTTLFARPEGLREVVDGLAARFGAGEVDLVAGIEARGFLVASALAYELGRGVALIRKPGKLPWKCTGEEYTLEYGTGRLEIHEDAVSSGQRVLIVDDLLATGGTARAAGRLLARLGATVAGYGFVVELDFLGGRAQLGHDNVFSLVHYV